MPFRNAFAAFSAFTVLFSGATSLIWSQSQADDANATAPVFKTISITANQPNRSGIHWERIHSGPNELRVTNAPLALLIQTAYQIDADQISAAPDWVNHEHYDIVAKVADPTGLRPILRALLSDRFKLAVHREIKLVPVYALVIAANGLKLAESIPATEDSRSPCSTVPAAPCRVIHVEEGRVAGREVPIATLAHILSDQLHQPVLDETDLRNHYDVTLEWQADADSSVAAVSQALEEQLGLKLIQQQMSKEFLVIDRVQAP